MNYKYLLIVLLVLCGGINANAQTKPRETKPVPFKVPKMSTLLGAYKDSVSLPRQEILDIVGMPLKIVDDKGVAYTVTAYQVAYKQRTVSETEDGKAIPATRLASERFYSTPMPAKWTDYIKEMLNKGEEIFFFDIIVKDPKGRAMYAPTLKLISL